MVISIVTENQQDYPKGRRSHPKKRRKGIKFGIKYFLFVKQPNDIVKITAYHLSFPNKLQ